MENKNIIPGRNKCLWCLKIRTDEEKKTDKHLCNPCFIKSKTCSNCKSIKNNIVCCDAFSSYQLCSICKKEIEERERKIREDKKQNGK